MAQESQSPSDRRLLTKPTAVLAAIVVAIVLLAVYLVSHYLSEENEPDSSVEYPSEDTPLSSISGGVRWTQWWEELSGLDYSGITVRLNWSNPSIPGPIEVEFCLIDAERTDSLDFIMTEDDFQRHIAYYSTEMVEIDLYYGVAVTDAWDDGFLNLNDSISVLKAEYLDGVLISEGFDEDTIFTFELTCEAGDGGTLLEPYCFAFHDDEFYSWRATGV